MNAGSTEQAEHWESLYREREPTAVSWYQPSPAISLAMFDRLGVGADQRIVDVGGGASVLVDQLVDRHFTDVTVLDIAAAAMGQARERLGESSERVHWLHQDVIGWRPDRLYEVWHDRAVFHFLVDERQRDAYLATLRGALGGPGVVVIGTFAADGPEQCSGLPVKRYDPERLAAVFGPEFDVVEQRREEHRTPSGIVQPFTWLGMRYRQ